MRKAMAVEEADVLEVFSLLRYSVNADPTLRHAAMNTLSCYEKRRGFCSCLMNIITGEGPSSDDVDVRLSASNYFEKTIMLYWGNSLFISDDEKTNLRNKLLCTLQEENDQIAEMLAIIISKIALFDYPQNWPKLFSLLAMQHEEGKGDILISRRILEVLSRTVSILSEKVLTVEDLRFAEILSQLFDSCWKLWEVDVGIVYGYLDFHPSVGQRDLTFGTWLHYLSEVKMQIMSRFRGGERPNEDLLESVCNAFRGTIKLLLYVHTFGDHYKLAFDPSICIGLVKCLVKIYNKCRTLDGEAVCGTIFMFCLEIIVRPIYGDPPFYEQLLIECMAMVKSVLKPPDLYELLFSHPTSNDTFIPSLQFQDKMQLCETLIRRYFFLTKDDLEKWSEDSESFYHETNPYHELERNAKKLRSHAEALYIVVFKSYGEWLGPVVLSILCEATNDRPAKKTDNNHEMLLREAAYTAVAHACPWLFGTLDFKKLFEGVLCPELCNGDWNMRILHRKIAFIVQNWAYKAEADMIKPVFRSLLKLLDYDDLAVKLAACRPLEDLFANIDFQDEDFMDLLQSYLVLSFKLLKEVHDLRSKELVLGCILSGIINICEKIENKSIISKIGEMIIPLSDMLVDEIEKAWNGSNSRMIVEISVLRALHGLNELGIHFPLCYKILLQVLKMSIDENDLYLSRLKCGMLLWESSLSHAPSMDSQLLELFDYLQKVVEKSFDRFPYEVDHINAILMVASKIIKGYIELADTDFWTTRDSDIDVVCASTSGKLDYIQQWLNGGLRKMDTEVDVDRDDGCERLKGQSMLSIKMRKVSGTFQASKGKLTKTSVEQQKDEKNIGALVERKEETDGCAKLTCCKDEGVENSEDPAAEDAGKDEKIATRLLTWFKKWDQGDVLMAVVVVLSSVAVAYSVYQRSG